MKELTLYQPPGRAWNTPNISPFCAKLECYLRMTEIPYKVAAMQALLTELVKNQVDMHRHMAMMHDHMMSQMPPK